MMKLYTIKNSIEILVYAIIFVFGQQHKIKEKTNSKVNHTDDGLSKNRNVCTYCLCT